MSVPSVGLRPRGLCTEEQACFAWRSSTINMMCLKFSTVLLLHLVISRGPLVLQGEYLLRIKKKKKKKKREKGSFSRRDDVRAYIV